MIPEWLRVLALRFLALFRRGRLERELSEDIQTHLEMLTAENVQHGMSSEEARYAARRSFGGVEQMKEVHRSQRSLRSLETLFQDLQRLAPTAAKSGLHRGSCDHACSRHRCEYCDV